MFKTCLMFKRQHCFTIYNKIHIFWGNQRGLIFGNPTEGNFVLNQADIEKSIDSKIHFALIKSQVRLLHRALAGLGSCPLSINTRNLYHWSLCSLLAQLFALAIPLLIQQIIDKVLTQGNLSSLNILGATMIILALFQGILQVLRTYVFVDTTDRLDLALGSSVITRLLSLPLSYF